VSSERWAVSGEQWAVSSGLLSGGEWSPLHRGIHSSLLGEQALQQWEAENAHIMETLRKEGREPKPEGTPREKKPEQPPARKEKVHGSGAHSREIKTPKKKKVVYGKARGGVDDDDDD
jgi:hypothetical protein